MRTLFLPGGKSGASISLLLLCVLLFALGLAGGASRADALGQIVVRTAAAAALCVAILAGARLPRREYGPVGLLLLAALGLALLQLVPLPPDVWQSLPGRALFSEASAVSGQAQPWRPWSITPGATANAAASLLVPATALTLMSNLDPKERALVPGLILALVAVSALIGMLQFAGAGFNNPLVNDTPGEVSGMMANRNHFALLLACGCALAPVWAFADRPTTWRVPIALGLIVLFALVLLASGSRTGLLVGATGCLLGFAIVWQSISRMMRRYPRWVLPTAIAGTVAALSMLVVISITADRAVAINRVSQLDFSDDTRGRALPTVLSMIETYFPFGSGLGGFDATFRRHEPFNLLKVTYFNHAHNDFLEIALDAGALGILLLAGGIVWWSRATLRAWKGNGGRQAYAKLGSALLLLVMIASLFDYPARTPLIMALMVVAGLWLCGSRRLHENSALP